MDLLLFSSCNTCILGVLKDIPTNVPHNGKRKEPERSTIETNTKKRAGAISNAVIEKLKKENYQLKREVEMFKNSWMRESFPS